MALTPWGYRSRLVDATVDRFLATAGALSIEGPKWCGKTWTSLHHANSVFYVSDPAGGFANRTVAQLDLAKALEGASPHAIDEWQEVPGIWDAVRFHVDAHPRSGQFLLTGSSTPADDAVAHSGTGRFLRVHMRPMTLFESGDATGAVSLASLLAGGEVSVAQSHMTLNAVTGLVVRGGWPALVDASPDQASDLTTGYIESLARTDMSQIDGRRRDPAKALALIRSLARNTATSVGVAALGRDIAQANGPDISPNTIVEYLTLMQRLYVLEQIPAWDPALRSPVKLRRAPKRMLVDPSLATAGLEASVADLKNDPKTLGFLFESLVLRDLLVYTQAMRATLSHYRDDSDLEVDAIISLATGAWAAIEIKLGQSQIDAAASSLLRLSNKLAANGDPRPIVLMVIVGIGAVAHRRDDGVFVIPIDLLGP